LSAWDLNGGCALRHFLYAFLIALTNNVDNIGARIAYSIRGIKITIPINLWISLITFVISFLAAFSGTKISGSFGKMSSVIATVILIVIGAKMILDQWMGDKCGESRFLKRWKGICHLLAEPVNADKDKVKHLDFKEATLLRYCTVNKQCWGRFERRHDRLEFISCRAFIRYTEFYCPFSWESSRRILYQAEYIWQSGDRGGHFTDRNRDRTDFILTYRN
jgi:hypothetical protein